MIAPSVVDEIRRLLAEDKWSYRKIAKMTGVSRGTVGAIANGRRRDYRPATKTDEEETTQPTGPPRRCPTCGGMVYMPCRLCRVRRHVEKLSRSGNARRPVRHDGPLRLELRGEHQVRYEEIRARRIRKEQSGMASQITFQSESES